MHPGKRRRRTHLQLREVLREEKKGTTRQKPVDRRGPDASAKESGHVQVLGEAEGEIGRVKKISQL